MCFGSHRRRRAEEAAATSDAQADLGAAGGVGSGASNADYDKVVNDAQELANSMGTFAKSMYDYSSNTVLNWQDQVNDRADKWQEKVDKWHNEWHEKERARAERRRASEYFPRPYELRSEPELKTNAKEDLAKGAGFGPFSGFWQSAFSDEGFGDRAAGGFSSGKTPYGYFAYGNPSIRAYNDCLDKDGQSVWDSNGYWRCLFPQREVEVKYLNYKDKYLPGLVLTKEDLARAAKEIGVSVADKELNLGQKGTFFTKFDDYLNWKNIMYENVKRDRKQKAEEWAAKKQKYTNSVQKPPINENRTATPAPAYSPKVEAPTVVSSSSQSTFNSNSETNLVELNEIKTEYFSDGTSITRNITKTKPFGATEWGNVSENVVKGDSSSSPTDKSKGWFWKD